MKCRLIILKLLEQGLFVFRGKTFIGNLAKYEENILRWYLIA